MSILSFSFSGVCPRCSLANGGKRIGGEKMQIIFYNNNSDDNAVPKDLNLLNTLTGELKDTTDILNPSILITSNVSLSANYMYIAAFNRYYFITTIEVVRAGLYRVTGKVDVLNSHWQEIKNCSVIAEKSRNLYNAFIVDGKRKFYQYTRAQYVKIGEDIGKPTTPILITVG